VKVAVVGGGIAGLSAAWELRDRAEVTVFEEGALGGCIQTVGFEGRPVELGPDAFITRVPEGMALCAELGLEADLVAPAAGRSLVWTGDRLREMPEGTVMGVPRRLGPVARSGIVSSLGVARAGLDRLLPARPVPDEVTVRDLVAGRLGGEVADRLVGPLVGAINAGDIAELGAAEAIPHIFAAARSSRSLLRALRTLPAPTGSGPLFLTPRLGLGCMVEALVAALEAAGTRFVSWSVPGPIRPVGTTIEIGPDRGFDATVLAVPPRRAAQLLAGPSSDVLAQVPTASVALLIAALEPVALPAGINGFVTAGDTGRLMTACSFASNKWPHWSEPGTPLVRISTGRRRDDRSSQMGEEELTSRLLDELGQALGVRVRAVATRLARWPSAFPQYRPGHLAAMSRLQEDLDRNLPGVALAGSAFGGIGIPACIASGRRAAERLLRFVDSSTAAY
jgi:oxygen-dependent protoporphyrinogen oxidase